MKTIVLSVFFMLNSIIACTQEKQDRPSAMKAIPAVPFLTRQNDFVYVDKTNLKSVINQNSKAHRYLRLQAMPLLRMKKVNMLS